MTGFLPFKIAKMLFSTISPSSGLFGPMEGPGAVAGAEGSFVITGAALITAGEGAGAAGGAGAATVPCSTLGTTAAGGGGWCPPLPPLKGIPPPLGCGGAYPPG